VVLGFVAPLNWWPVSAMAAGVIGLAFLRTRAQAFGLGLLAGVLTVHLVLFVVLPWLWRTRYPGVD
jgi:hypothetical protein